ncbi:hypothetical protein [Synechococcus sp. RedBA-s]|uniref:hypothetical protein n=1 Tax=Synechococcus sp. RedBA-s TaxID=2823741 RepID=UPI0020CD2660|nr:hypothetical protein [Synechococcus sp. RedBA-s]MCP9799617.1 hypothetical protein [Synechococcus sp. RedBA-s]
MSSSSPERLVSPEYLARDGTVSRVVVSFPGAFETASELAATEPFSHGGTHPAHPSPSVRGSAQRASQRCSHCGGSGVLRLGGRSFRTCLDCLGQGSLADHLAAPRDISAA